MTRHARVGDNAFILPPPKRDAEFEAHKLARLKSIYQLVGGAAPHYEYEARRASVYKREFRLLMQQFVAMAHFFRLYDHGFKLLSHYVYTEDNYFNRDPGYYASIKHALELIYVRLEAMALQDNVLVKKQAASHLAFIEEQIQMCGPGVFTSLNKVAQDLDQENSEEAWLEKMRQTILRNLQEEHVEQWAIDDGSSIHVLNKLKQVAHQLSFSIVDGEKFAGFADEWERYALFDANAAAVNAARMFERFNPRSIVENLTTNYCELFSTYRNPAAERRYQQELATGGVAEVKDEGPVGYSNLSEPDNLAHFTSTCARLQESGVVYSVNDVLEFNDDYTHCYISPKFIHELPKHIKEHATRRGLIKSVSIQALHDYVEQVAAEIQKAKADPYQLVPAKTIVMLEKNLSELKQLFDLPLRIADGEFGIEEKPCLYYEQRGEAAFHIMQTCLAAYQPKTFTLMAEGCEPISRQSPLLEGVRACVERYRTVAAEECDLNRSRDSYAALQEQNKRLAAYRQLVRERDAQKKIARVFSGVIFRKRYLRDRKRIIKVQSVARQLFAKRRVRHLHGIKATTRALSTLKREMMFAESHKKFNSWRLVFGMEQSHEGRFGELINVYRPFVRASLQQCYHYMLKRGVAAITYIMLSEQNSLHTSQHVNYQRGQSFVPYKSAEGDVTQVKVRFVKREDFDWLHIRECFHLRLLLDSYLKNVAHYWATEWVTSTNIAAILKCSSAFSDESALNRSLRFSAQLLQYAEGRVLTEAHGRVIDLWVGNKPKADALSEEQALEIAQEPGGLERLAALLQMDRRLLTAGSIEKLGGLAALRGEKLECLLALSANALECAIAPNDSVALTDRGLKVVHVLMSLSPEQRGRWIEDINQRVRRKHPCGIIADAVLGYKREYKAVARKFGGPEFFTPALLEREVIQLQLDKCFNMGRSMAAAFMREGVKQVELDYWLKSMDAWKVPYSDDQVRELNQFFKVLAHLAREFCHRRQLSALQVPCAGLVYAVDDVCRRVGIEQKEADTAVIGSILHGLRKAATKPIGHFRLV